MEKTIVISQCRPTCPFFWEGQDGMECQHPYWDGKDFTERMIITMDNSHMRVPDECPLLEEPITVVHKLSEVVIKQQKYPWSTFLEQRESIQDKMQRLLDGAFREEAKRLGWKITPPDMTSR